MTRASIREYTEAVRWRYLSATKKGKGKILDKFIQVTGYHHKAAIRLLHRVSQPSTSNKRGRPRQYSAAVVGALRLVWEATDRLCSKRLKPFLASCPEGYKYICAVEYSISNTGHYFLITPISKSRIPMFLTNIIA